MYQLDVDNEASVILLLYVLIGTVIDIGWEFVLLGIHLLRESMWVLFSMNITWVICTFDIKVKIGCFLFSLYLCESLLLIRLHCWLFLCRLAGDQRARRDVRHDSDAEDDDDVKKVNYRMKTSRGQFCLHLLNGTKLAYFSFDLFFFHSRRCSRL